MRFKGFLRAGGKVAFEIVEPLRAGGGRTDGGRHFDVESGITHGNLIVLGVKKEAGNNAPQPNERLPGLHRYRTLNPANIAMLPPGTLPAGHDMQNFQQCFFWCFFFSLGGKGMAFAVRRSLYLGPPASPKHGLSSRGWCSCRASTVQRLEAPTPGTEPVPVDVLPGPAAQGTATPGQRQEVDAISAGYRAGDSLYAGGGGGIIALSHYITSTESMLPNAAQRTRVANDTGRRRRAANADVSPARASLRRTDSRDETPPQHAGRERGK